MSDELHTDDVSGGLTGFVRGIGELDAAALTAAAGVDLGLDGDGDGEVGGDGRGIVGRGGDAAAGDGDAVSGEELLGLVFVDLHGSSV